MPELPSPEAFGDYDAWRGRAVTDRDGSRVGSVDELYLDTDTRRPEWVLIRLDDDEDKRRFVPLADARVESEELRLAHARDRIAAAPAASPGPIPQGQERALYEHYAVPVTEAESETVLPSEGAPSADEATSAGGAGVAAAAVVPEPAPAEEDDTAPAETQEAPTAAEADATPEPTTAADSDATTETPTAADADATPETATAGAPITPDASAPGPAPGDPPSAPPELVADEGTAPPDLTTPSTPGTAGTATPPPPAPPLPTPPATDGGGPNRTAIGASAGIVLFVLLLIIRSRRR